MQEILRLKQILESEGFKFEYIEEDTGMNVDEDLKKFLLNHNNVSEDFLIHKQIIVRDTEGKKFVSVVQHYASYGADENKLEIMLNENYNTVEGWFTAEEILKILNTQNEVAEQLYKCVTGGKNDSN